MKQLFFLIFSMSIIFVYGQNTVNGTYKEYKPGIYEQEIKASLSPSQDIKARTYFAADLSGMDFPTDPEKYNQYWHFPPHSQGRTGTCWCFATISFLESEVYRLSGDEIKLSEMYIVYWEYVERAHAFVENRGEIYFAEGSEATSVTRIMKKYGIVPSAEYPGIPKGQDYHDHSRMQKEMRDYLESIKINNAWNTVVAVSTIREILDKYMGVPPQDFVYNDEHYTPLSFLNEALPIVPDDYFSFMSTMSATYNQQGELVEPDNWWHCDDYYNVSIDDFLLVIDDALDGAYSVCICGDVSEPGYDSWAEVGIIPAFDLPSDQINESSREMRLRNGSTTDDHCIHIIGYYDIKGVRWYMIKDSGAGGFNGKHKGYRFLHEDYVRLKMMNTMIYKEAGRRVLDKIIK
ncbi:MAG: C1 family peptidase [Bacteroidota bacterium]